MWVGVYFSPFIVLIQVIKLVVMFFVQAVSQPNWTYVSFLVSSFLISYFHLTVRGEAAIQNAQKERVNCQKQRVSLVFDTHSKHAYCD